MNYFILLSKLLLHQVGVANFVKQKTFRLLLVAECNSNFVSSQFSSSSICKGGRGEIKRKTISVILSKGTQEKAVFELTQPLKTAEINLMLFLSYVFKKQPKIILVL